MSSLTQHVYDLLRDRVITGITPAGARLSDRDLSREFNIGRTPIRQAIERMHREGLVEKYPQGGYRIARPSLEELIEIFEMRQMLEAQAVGYAAKRITTNQLDRLESLNQQMYQVALGIRMMKISVLDGAPARRVNRIDAEFHITIIEAAKNPRLTEIIRKENFLIRIFGFRQHGMQHNALSLVSNSILKWHLRITSALKEGDSDTAEECMRLHLQKAISNTRQDLNLTRSVEENPLIEASGGECEPSESEWSPEFLNLITSLDFHKANKKST